MRVTLLATGFNCDVVANEGNGNIGRTIAMEHGGPFAKIKYDQFRYLFAFAVKWANKKLWFERPFNLRL